MSEYRLAVRSEEGGVGVERAENSRHEFHMKVAKTSMLSTEPHAAEVYSSVETLGGVTGSDSCVVAVKLIIMDFVILQMAPVQPGRDDRESVIFQMYLIPHAFIHTCICVFVFLFDATLFDNFHGKHTYNMPKYMGEEKQVVPRLEIWIHVSIYKDTLSG